MGFAIFAGEIAETMYVRGCCLYLFNSIVKHKESWESMFQTEGGTGR